MQQFGLLLLELTRQRSAQRYGTSEPSPWLDGGSQYPPLRLHGYESACAACLREQNERNASVRSRAGRAVAALLTRRDSKIETLRRLAIFSGLSDRELKSVAKFVDNVDLPAGHTLIREGERGREFFLIAEGTVSVSQNGRPLGEIGPGGWVGEIALMSDTPRTATVATSSPAHLFVTTERGFRQLVEGWRSVARQIEGTVAERTGALAR
jgi:CRP/FNR family transcriptional regulator, cyclic AMP receptor protein